MFCWYLPSARRNRLCYDFGKKWTLFNLLLHEPCFEVCFDFVKTYFDGVIDSWCFTRCPGPSRYLLVEVYAPRQKPWPNSSASFQSKFTLQKAFQVATYRTKKKISTGQLKKYFQFKKSYFWLKNHPIKFLCTTFSFLVHFFVTT